MHGSKSLKSLFVVCSIFQLAASLFSVRRDSTISAIDLCMVVHLNDQTGYQCHWLYMVVCVTIDMNLKLSAFSSSHIRSDPRNTFIVQKLVNNVSRPEHHGSE